MVIRGALTRAGVEAGETFVITGAAAVLGCGTGAGGRGRVIGGSLTTGSVVIAWLELDAASRVFGSSRTSIKGVGSIEGISSGTSFDAAKNAIRTSAACAASESPKLRGKPPGSFGCRSKEELIGDVWVTAIQGESQPSGHFSEVDGAAALRFSIRARISSREAGDGRPV